MDLLTAALWLRERKWIGYAAAPVGAVLGLYLHLALDKALASATFLTFFPGIFVAAVAGGSLVGAIAIVISAGLSIYYLLPPIGSLAVSWPNGFVEVGLFLVISAGLVALINYAVVISANVARTTALLRASNDALAALSQDRASKLQDKEALIQTFFEHSSQCHAVFVVCEDNKFRFEEVNPATLRLYGTPREEIIGCTLEEILSGDQATDLTVELTQCLHGTEPHQYERLHGDKVIEAVATLVPREEGGTQRVVVTATDVTERRRLEQQLRQSQKMEAVGQLTGGLAHDFNNLLTGISGSIELLENRIAKGRTDDLQSYLDIAKSAAKRAAALTHRLLAFSRMQALDPRPTDVNRLVSDLDELVRRTVGPAITVEFITAAGLWPTLIDQNQLENAVLNLCINARDAMPNGGRLTVETGNKWLDQRAAKECDLPAGQYVSLCVSDTGSGMPADVIARAFDPFFTTKPVGGGTGLGLSMVYGFARQSGGQARIYSEVNKGTIVCLYLPRHYGETEQPEVHSENIEKLTLENGETVLVVDDETAVRQLVTEVLEEMGLTSIEAEDGKIGMKILQSGRRIDMLITDVGLPGGINGRQLAEAGMELRPALKVLFITGYAENAVVGDGHLERGMHVLTKPFAIADLARRVKDILS